MSTDYSEIKEMLDKLDKTPVSTIVPRKTFMTVSGYPHYENVVSNILAFFFCDSEEHGMGNLWIKSFLSACDIADADTQNVTVEREVYTEKANRIDLLITTDDYLICIENKIFSEVGNDLEDYHNFTSERAKIEKKKAFCYLLSPAELDYKKQDKKDGFRNITYGKLFQAVRENIGEYLENCSNTWLAYMKDFISTIERLTEDSVMMDREFEKFYKEHYTQIDDLQKKRRDFLLALQNETTKVCNKLSERSKEADSNIGGLTWQIYSPSTIDLSSVRTELYTDKNKKIIVETSRDVFGWHITIYKYNKAISKDIGRIIEDFKCDNAEMKKYENTYLWNSYYKDSHYIIENIDASSSEGDLTKIAEKIAEAVGRIKEIVTKS